MALPGKQASNVVVRRATPGDKTAVLNINKNDYEGLDYLPYAYDSLTSDPSYTYYVAEVDSAVVAFYGVCLIDGGKTLMARSGKVKEELRGQGILGHILQSVYRDFSPQYHVTRDLKVAVAMGDTCALVNRASFRKRSELVWTRTQKIFKSDLHNLSAKSSASESGSYSSVKELSQDAFLQLVDSMSSSLRRYIFPTDVFTLFTWHFQVDQLSSCRNVWGNWDPHFTLTSSLMETSVSPGQNKEASGEEESCHGAQSQNSHSGVLTASMATRTPSGPIVFVDIFGKVTETEDLKAHLKKLVPWLTSQSVKVDAQTSSVYVLLCTNTKQEEEVVTRELELLGFEDWHSRMKEMHYFWQDFETLKS